MAEYNNNKEKRRVDPGTPPGGPGVKPPRFNPYWIYGLIAVLFIVVNFYLTGSKGPVETTWNKVRTTMLVSNDIDRMVVINKEKAHIYLKNDRVSKYEKDFQGTFTKPAETGPHFYFVIGSIETFERNLAEAQENIEMSQRIEPEYRNERNWMGELLWTIGPFILIILLWLWALDLPADEPWSRRWLGRYFQRREISGQGIRQGFQGKHYFQGCSRIVGSQTGSGSDCGIPEKSGEIHPFGR